MDTSDEKTPAFLSSYKKFLAQKIASAPISGLLSSDGERFRYTHDPRLWFAEGYDPSDYEVNAWRHELRGRLLSLSKGRSMLSGKQLDQVEVHEGLFPRRYVPKNIAWQWRLFSGINCFLLHPDEHCPQPPDRTTCYWISCAIYGQEIVDLWIDELPFKAPPDMPWRGTSFSDLPKEIQTLYT